MGRRQVVPPAEYYARRAAGEAWCSYHQQWEPVTYFGPSYTRPSQIKSVCRQAGREMRRRLRQRQREGAS